MAKLMFFGGMRAVIPAAWVEGIYYNPGALRTCEQDWYRVRAGQGQVSSQANKPGTEGGAAIWENVLDVLGMGGETGAIPVWTENGWAILVSGDIKVNSIEAAGQAASGSVATGALSAASSDAKKGTDVTPESASTSDLEAYTEGETKIEGAVGQTATHFFSIKGAELKQFGHDQVAAIQESGATGSDPVVKRSEVADDTKIPPSGSVALTIVGGVITPDFALGNFFEVTLDGNPVTIANPLHPVKNQTGCIVLRQPAGGGSTIAYGNKWTFVGRVVPPVSTTANAVNKLWFHVTSVNEIDGELRTNVGVPA